MSRTLSRAEARAARLVRWYPKEWRARYGEELSELLADEMTERPRSFARSLDVAVGAFMAHLAAHGLSGTTIDPADQPRRSLATLGSALAIFLAIAVSIWSHLVVASRSAHPSTAAIHTAIVLMTAAVVVSVTAAAAATILIASAAALTVVRRQKPGLNRPSLLFLAGIAVLIGGAIAFHSGWATNGTNLWLQRSAAPGGPVGLLWASTLTVSAYWAHPTILLSLPASEIAWMAISPIAFVAAVVGGARAVRQLDLPLPLLRFVVHMAEVVTAGLGVFVVGALWWLVEGHPGPGRQFQAGTVDWAGLVIMTATFAVAVRSIQRMATRFSISH